MTDFARQPAMRICLPLVCGIACGNFAPLSMISLWLLLFSLAFALFLLSRRIPLRIRSALHYLALVLFGMYLLRLHDPSKDREWLSNLAGQRLVLTGIALDKPILRDRFASVVVRADTILHGGKKYPYASPVLVRIKDVKRADVQSLVYGASVRLTGMLSLPRSARNPGEFDYRKYLQLKGIEREVEVREDDVLEVGSLKARNVLSLVIYPLREWIGNNLDTLIGGEESKLMKGLVIGERSEMDPNIKAAFTNTGLMHLLAVSGFNVALVAGIMLACCSMFRIGATCGSVVTCAGLVCFGFLTGAQASVMRAVFMAIVALVGKRIDRYIELYNTVAVAVIALLLMDPRSLFDVGFQLSFIAVLGLSYFNPKLLSFSEMFPPSVRDNFVVKYLLASLAVSVAASLGTLPLSALYFHKISLIGLIINIVAVPISGILLSLGFATVAAASVSTWIASMYASLATFLSRALLDLTLWSSHSPVASVKFVANEMTVVGLYGIFLFLSSANLPFLRKIILLLLVWANVWVFTSMTHDSHLRVTFIDVGQGDAILLECPDGRVVLIDAGPSMGRTDSGERFIGPLLDRKGITRIDEVILSHPHNDHGGGIPFLLREFDVGRIVLSHGLRENGLTREVRRLADSLHVSLSPIHVGEVLDERGSVRLYILFPSRTIQEDGENVNNRSIVIKLVYGRTSMLLSGDAEEEAEASLVGFFGAFLDCDVLKLGHHGSITSSSKQFLHAVSPDRVVISVGRGNKFRHPSAEVIDRVRNMKAMIHRTDENGAVILNSDGYHWSEEEWD